MTVKIFSNNSSLTAQEELEIVNSREFNLGNTDYYVDSTSILKCNNPYNHGCTTITLCESLSDIDVFTKVEENCRKLIKELGEDDILIDSTSVRLLSIYNSGSNFYNGIRSGYDYDITINSEYIQYLENRSEEYPKSDVRKRGPVLNPKKADKNNPFRAIINGGNDFRNVPYTRSPYSSAVMIIGETSYTVGSGVFISPRVILSCRHNFYNNDGSFAQDTYSYVQGSNSASNVPNVTTGTKTQIDVSKIIVNNDVYKPVSPTDIAVVVTETPCEITYSEGTYSNLIDKNIPKDGIDISIIGYPYPNDVPEVKDKMQHGFLYESTGRVGIVDDGMLVYRIDTLGGNSGSGVFHDGKVIGVHVGGAKNEANVAVELDDNKLQWLKQIISENKANGWYEHNGKKYYYDDNNMIKSTKKSIDGKTYTFDDNGVVTSEEDETNSSNSSNDSNGSGKKSSTTVGNNGTHLWRFNDFAMWNGDTRQGSTNSSVNKDLNGSGNSSSNGNNSNPSNTGQLAGKLKDAVASALDSSNWNAVTDGGNPGIDVDSFPAGAEAQCFDLANYYLMQLGIGWSRTNVDAWGAFNFPLQYKSQFESLGWKLIEYPTLSQLVPGAITFENNQGVALGEVDYGGHTEIITSIEGTSVSFLTQNPNSPTIVTVDGGGEPLGYGYRIQLIAVPPS